jgi:hypothetical protein
VVLPQGQQAQLSSIQIILDIDRGAQGMELDLIKAIPERLGSEALGRKLPERREQGALVPIGHLGFRAGVTDAVQGGQ